MARARSPMHLESHHERHTAVTALHRFAVIQAEPAADPRSADLDCGLDRTLAALRPPGQGPDDLERKSLSSFSFGNTGWVIPPQISTRILSCLTDRSDVLSMCSQETISAGSIQYPIDIAAARPFCSAIWSISTWS